VTKIISAHAIYNFGPNLNSQIRSQIGTVFHAPKRPQFSGPKQLF